MTSILYTETNMAIYGSQVNNYCWPDVGDKLQLRWKVSPVVQSPVQCLQTPQLSTQYRSLNSGLDYWTGLLDWTTGFTSDLNCRGHNIIEPCPKGCNVIPRWGLGMRISRTLNSRVMRLRASVSGLMEITHTSVGFAIWHIEACWQTMITQVRIADLTFNYFTYTRIYVWTTHNKLLASLQGQSFFLFW